MPAKRGRKRKAQVKKVEVEEKEEFSIRDFLDPESISQHLFCSICQEVFVNPHRAPCGHSYCKICIDTWLKKSKSCPDDRKVLKPSDLHHDFLLENIIMDQKVACPNRDSGCHCVVPLSTLSFHIKNCKPLPEFLKDEQQTNVTGEDNDTTNIPLKMRIYQAGGSHRENLIKAFDKPEGLSTYKMRRLVELVELD